MNVRPDEYGVFGHPVGHSLSPFIHSMFARATQQNLVYRPYEVRPEELGARVRSFFAAGGRGLNLTLPHKIPALELAEELTARATHAAAVNTLVMKGDKLLGDNTDGTGLVRDLCNNLGLTVTFGLVTEARLAHLDGPSSSSSSWSRRSSLAPAARSACSPARRSRPELRSGSGRCSVTGR